MLRVAVSNVRMPRSQSTTLGLPSDMMYSALMSSSCSELEKPRLRSTGRRERPISFSSSKFCMLRAPTWSMSAYSSKSSICDGLVISETTGSPVASRASLR